MAISFGVDKLEETCYNNTLQHLSLAQLDRVPGYEPGGREFESLRARHIITPTHVGFLFSL